MNLNITFGSFFIASLIIFIKAIYCTSFNSALFVAFVLLVWKIKKDGKRNPFFRIDFTADTDVQVSDDKKFIISDNSVSLDQ